MGFYLQDEFASELKQHINLSDSAWFTINEDIREFDPDHESFSGLLNQVFLNFYQEASASIWFQKGKRKIELLAELSGPEFQEIDQKTKDLFIEKSLAVYQNELLEKARSYPKGKGQKFRINKEMLSLLRDSNEGPYYDNTIGEYLKAFYEEYARLPRYRREAIYFKKTMDVIQKSIEEEAKVKITQFSKSNVAQTKRYANQFYVAPYKIVQDPTLSFNYVLGYSQKNEKETTTSTVPETRLGDPASLRISRIARIAEITSMGGHISKENKERLDKLLIERTASFFATGPEDIVVLFSQKGLDSFRSQIYMRPSDYEIKAKKEDGSAEICFHCSEIQAINYLFNRYS
jgi:hypothetical protein